jgi:hypothetical protein
MSQEFKNKLATLSLSNIHNSYLLILRVEGAI